MKITINKYPYFLWASYRVKNPQLDTKNSLIKGDDGESHYKKASGLEILLLKYIPLLLIIPFIYLPISQTGWIDILLSLLLFGLFMFFKIKHKESFMEWGIYFMVAITALLAVVYGENTIDSHFFNIFHHIVTWMILLYVVKDYIEKDYKSYYKLSKKKYVEKTFIEEGKRSFMKIPFSKKHLIKYKVKNPLRLKMNIGGFYFIQSKNQGEMNVSK